MMVAFETSASFKFSQRSLNNLEEVHPQLVAVAHRALELTKVDFVVIEGKRSMERQKYLKGIGASQTLKSKHLKGRAIDVAAWVDGKVNWDFKYYRQIADAMKQAASELNVEIIWGGDWANFKDGPHFELK